MKNCVLLDAKAKYSQFVVKSTGMFKDWFLKSETGGEGLIKEATRQLAASEGAEIEWHFAEEAAMNATEKLFESREITGIKFIFEPKI